MASGSDDATEQREIKYDRKECVRLLYLAFLRKNERSRNKNEEIKSVARQSQSISPLRRKWDNKDKGSPQPLQSLPFPCWKIQIQPIFLFRETLRLIVYSPCPLISGLATSTNLLIRTDGELKESTMTFSDSTTVVRTQPQPDTKTLCVCHLHFKEIKNIHWRRSVPPSYH